jgi:hypothetical protein
MMGESAASFSPSQLGSQRPECEIGQTTGARCALPATAATGFRFCQRHDPEQIEQRRAQARQAAKASHSTFRPDPALEAWAATLASSNEETRAQALREVAAFVAKGALTPAQGNAIAALARVATTKQAKTATPAPRVLHVVTPTTKPPEAS